MVLFASGGGSNARTICEHFQHCEAGEVVGLVTNNSKSGIFEIGRSFDLPALLLSRSQVKNGEWLSSLMRFLEADLIVLAGYIRLIPESLVKAYPNRIVNIHPSLLPHHGGKGMFGMNVHKSVISSGDLESGITIHYVNEVYDDGEPILQKRLTVLSDWSATDLQQAVLKLEHHWYPQVLESLCQQVNSQRG